VIALPHPSTQRLGRPRTPDARREARDALTTAGLPPTVGVRLPAKSGPAPLRRPGPDIEGEVHSVLAHRNARGADQAPIDGLIGTRYTLEVCVLWGHECVRAARQQTSCPECGASARRSFAVFRSVRVEQT
jgi:hypothetical protein